MSRNYYTLRLTAQNKVALVSECVNEIDLSAINSWTYIVTPSVIDDDDIKSDFDDRFDESSSGNEYIPSVNSLSSTTSESFSEH